tara:strand:+ start:1183 stop:1299 length:117 start_codon:yes stop_codon:yes gene_type:complete
MTSIEDIYKVISDIDNDTIDIEKGYGDGMINEIVINKP